MNVGSTIFLEVNSIFFYLNKEIITWIKLVCFELYENQSKFVCHHLETHGTSPDAPFWHTKDVLSNLAKTGYQTVLIYWQPKWKERHVIPVAFQAAWLDEFVSNHVDESLILCKFKLSACIRLPVKTSAFCFRVSSCLDLVRIPAKKHARGCRQTGDLVIRTTIFRAFAHVHARKRMELPKYAWSKKASRTNRTLYKLAPASCFPLIHCNRAS
jgi:hypothetical protein